MQKTLSIVSTVCLTTVLLAFSGSASAADMGMTILQAKPASSSSAYMAPVANYVGTTTGGHTCLRWLDKKQKRCLIWKR